MAKRLLDRQASLLEYLTSGAAIFGDNDHASLDQNLQRIDDRLLHLEARFSHQKRMEKILAVFPRTFDILGDDRAAIVREFAESCPPTDISRLVNASQFCHFLSARGRSNSERPYLPDVAACELARATVRVAFEHLEAGASSGGKRRSRRLIRRCPAIALLRCAYDIRPIFERDAVGIAPERRDTLLAVAIARGSDEPKVFELVPVAFDLLAALDDWTDPTAFGKMPEVKGLIAELLEHGLLEVNG